MSSASASNLFLGKLQRTLTETVDLDNHTVACLKPDGLDDRTKRDDLAGAKGCAPIDLMAGKPDKGIERVAIRCV